MSMHDTPITQLPRSDLITLLHLCVKEIDQLMALVQKQQELINGGH